MARRRITQAQIRDRRSKRLAIGLGLLFVVVMGIQGPKLLKQLKNAPPAPVDTTAPSTPPAGAASTGATGTNGAGTLAAANVPRQLTSFSLLPMKDPFGLPYRAATGTPDSADEGDSDAETAAAKAAEGSTDAESAAKPAAAEGTAATAPLAAAGPPAGQSTAKASTAKASTAKASTASKPPTVKFTVPPPNAALITTNGRPELVFVGSGFPSAQPMFKVVSLAKNKKGKRIGVRIGVLGGSFVGNAPTLLLANGHKVTLADQTDGSQYVIEVVRLTTATPPPPTTSTATTATATTATATTATATTPTTTTPATTTPTTTTPAAPTPPTTTG